MRSNQATRSAATARRALGGLFLAASLLLAPAAGGCASQGARERKERGFEIVHKLDRVPGNITVTRDGRRIISLHQFYNPEWRVGEIDPETSVVRPFPNIEWAGELGTDGIGLDSVLGIITDDNDIVWMLDNGARSGHTPRLIGWDLNENALHRVFAIPNPPGVERSFLNDLVRDPRTEHVYITDTGGDGPPSLVVLDLRTGLARRVLVGDPSVSPEPGVDLIVENEIVTRPVERDGRTVAEPMRIGANAITIDPAGQWVYYGATNSNALYRIRTSFLRDPQLNDTVLAGRVEVFSEDKPVSDGITVDERGNIYVTDLDVGGIGVINRGTRRYEPLFADSVVTPWVDGLSGGPDGLIYATVNQLHHSPELNNGRDRSLPPYLVIRIDSRAKPIVGR